MTTRDRPAHPAAGVVAAGLRHGFVLNNPTPRRIRLVPPLVLTDDDADALLAAWPAILDDAYAAADAATDPTDGKAS